MFWERFYALCMMNNKKPTPVGREMGISSGVISTWKKEGYCPSGEMLIKISDYFDCSIDYLVGKSDSIKTQKSDLSHDELKMLEKFHTLSKDDQDELLHILDYKYKNTKYNCKK